MSRENHNGDGPRSPMDTIVLNLFNVNGPDRRITNKLTTDEVKNFHDVDTKYVQTVMSEMVVGDTIIIINVPMGHYPNRSCSGATFPRSYRLQTSSEALRSSGFRLFPRLLDDKRYQSRKMARLLATEKVPDGVEYVLDLGPGWNEDIQSAQLQVLTLPKGIRCWHRTQHVQPRLKAPVGGHDDCCECGNRSPSPPPPDADSWARSIWDCTVEPKFRDIEDYCEVRHAANVVRLLRKIAGLPGGDLVLDSAPRVYTIAGIAKLFEISFGDETAWLRDSAKDWMISDGNGILTEILTEDAIIMSSNLLIPQVTRTAFRLLACEYALHLESGVQAPPGGHRYSVFGRPLRDVNDDEILTAVEHAGQALVGRVLGVLARLRSDGLLESLRLPAWREITDIESGYTEVEGDLTEFKQCCQDVRLSLLGVIRGLISDAMSAKSARDGTYDWSLHHFVPNARFRSFMQVWLSLRENQKALTSAFWRSLENDWPKEHLAVVAKRMGFDLGERCRRLSDAMAVLVNKPNPLAPPKIHSLSSRLGYQLHQAIATNICGVLWSPDRVSVDKGETHHLSISTFLLTALNEDEMRFLPLWAGGLNDESGGVYEFDAPPSDMGPSGPGPSYHTGYTVASETRASSVAGNLTEDDCSTTVGSLGMGDLGVQSLSSVGSLGLDDLDVQTATDAAVAPDRSTAPPGSSVAPEDHDDDSLFSEARRCHHAGGQAVAQPSRPHFTVETVRSVASSNNGVSDDDVTLSSDDASMSEVSTPTPSVAAWSQDDLIILD